MSIRTISRRTRAVPVNPIPATPGAPPLKIEAPLRTHPVYGQVIVRHVIARPWNGVFELTEPQQGRHTYGSAEEAQARLDAILMNNNRHTIESTMGHPDDLAVVAVICYPHGDPCARYFKSDEHSRAV